jgi:phosphatidylglycerophosphate synthase
MNPGRIAPWIPLIGLLATMPIFAIRHRSGRLDVDLARRPTTILLGRWLRSWLVWAIAPVERSLVRLEVSPDLLNFVGLGFGVAAGAAYVAGRLAIAAWLVALGGLADVLDGRVARARRVASAYGEFLDSTLDRFAEGFTFAGIAWYLRGSSWTAAATVLAIAGSMLVSYVRAKGESLGVSCAGGVAQRAERLVVLAVATLISGTIPLPAPWPADSLLIGAVVAIAIGSLGTAIYRVAFIARALAAGSTVELASTVEPRTASPGAGTESPGRE